jgi:uncharacterized protein with beta-barrel porin domain
MSGVGVSRADDRSRLRLLLATSSFAALLIAGGAPAAWATSAQRSCNANLSVNGETIGSVTNSSPSGNCILVQSGANVTGNVTNTSSGILTANGNGEALPTGIVINNSTVGGNVSNAGMITAETVGILVTNGSTVSGGISNSHIIFAGSGGTGSGIVVTNATVSGGISNSGMISASRGNGIFVGGTVADGTVTIATFSGGITNSGIITTEEETAFEAAASLDPDTAPAAKTESKVIERHSFGGVVTGIANAGVGIWVGGAAQSDGETGASVTLSNFSGGIVNSATGTITAGGAGIFVGGVASSGSGNALASVTIGNFADGIANSGTITADGAGIFVGGRANDSTNSGTASASVTVSNFASGITNSGMIAAGVAGIFVGGEVDEDESQDGVTISTFSGGISNSGTIMTLAVNNGDGDANFTTNDNAPLLNTVRGNGIWVGGTARSGGAITISNFSGGVNNSGLISVGNNGIFVGGQATEGSDSTVTIANFFQGIRNFGTLVAGNNGIWVGGSARSGGTVTISNFSGGINNSGLISAYGNGIFVGGFVGSGDTPGTVTISTFSGNIRNSGTIVAGASADGILVSGVQNFLGHIINTGTISGDVGIMVTNSGAVSVFDSGTIIGTGGTAVELAGDDVGYTFTLGPGYSFGSTSNVYVAGSGNDTFQLGGIGNGNFNLSDIGTLYTGFTTFNVVGGVWNTSGTFDIGTPLTWTVQGGTLAGASTFGTSTNPVSIDVKSGGILAPGTFGTPGTFMTVTGDVTLEAGAIYEVFINSTTASRVNVTGVITLNNNLVGGVLTPGSYSGSTVYDILDPPRIAGELARFYSENAPGFGGTLNDPPTDVTLQLVAQLGSGVGLAQNQQNVATSINTFFNNGGTLPASFFPLFTLTGGSLANALTQIDGEDATGAQRAAFDQMTEFLGLMLDPFVDGRGGGNGTVPALGFSRDEQDELPADVALAYARLLKAPAASPAPALLPHWTTWAAGFGGSATTNGDPTVGSNNVTASTYGYAAGMDYHYSPNTVLGFSLAGGGTNWNLANALGTGSSDSFLLGVYGVTHQGPWYIGGALAFANNWFTTNRTAFAGDQLSASFQGQDYAARLEGGYRYVVSLDHHAIGVTPYAALQTQDFHTPTYSETDLSGGGFGLSYSAMNGTDTRSEVGSRFDDLAAIANMPLLLRAKVAWAHDWTSNPALSASFEALPGASFTVNGAPIPQDSALTSVGAQLWFMPNWSLLAKFDGEFASGSQTYAGSGTVRYTW